MQDKEEKTDLKLQESSSESPQKPAENPKEQFQEDITSPATTPKRKSKKKKKKVVYINVDDDYTVYDMSGVDGKKRSGKDDVKLTRRERRAAIRAALAYYTPILLLVIGCFCLVGLGMYYWLR